MKKMTIITRILTLLAAAAIVSAVYLPIWKIDLVAPQYPEGLYMNIWADKLGGDIAIINGLNHYIGMRTLHVEDFPEFKILPSILWGFGILGLIVAIVGRRKIFFGFFTLFLLFAILAMVDFYRWEYDYGHNLDPNAPIQVPGMAYQPPLIGYKQLLNFAAYSIPDKGGWLMMSGGVLLLAGVIVEWMKQRKLKKAGMLKPPGTLKTAVAVIMVMTLLGCAAGGPVSIRFGKDLCDHCKMVIMDQKFGGEIITSKGKCYRFDDTKCLVAFSKGDKKDDASSIYLLDYYGNGNFVALDSAFLLSSPTLHSPMGGNVAAFSSEASREKAIQTLGGTPLATSELMK